jgi:5'-nucleotidase
MRWPLVLVLLAACHDDTPSPPDMALGTAEVRILAFNDLHGQLQPDGPGDPPGATHLAAQITALRTPNTVVVSAGDLIGGSPLVSGLFHDEPIIEAANALGLDLHGVGNHEFDEGVPELLRMKNGGCHPVDGCRGSMPFAGAVFPFLAANVSYASTGEPIFPGYVIKDVGGARIAFVGMTLENTPATTLASKVKELAFADEADTVNALVPELKAQGASAIVVLLHQGGAITGDVDACAHLSGPLDELVGRMDDAVTFVASGHTHAGYNCMIGNKVVTSAGAKGQLVTQVDLTIDLPTQTVTAITAHNLLVDADSAGEPAVQAIADRFEALAAPIGEMIVGTITEAISNGSTTAGESPMGDLIADAMLAGASAKGAQIAFMNSGGVRASLRYDAAPGETAPGQVRYAEAFQVQPFGDALSVYTLSGADVVAALDAWACGGDPILVAGVTYTFRAGFFNCVGTADVLVGATPIDPAASYGVVTNEIIADPAQTPSITHATSTVAAGTDLDLFSAYFAAHSPVAPPPLVRITRN